jgi:ferrous iron transport protein B
MKRVALIGMPNTGKSTLFNRTTGAGARIGNWPGITVDLLSARILLGSEDEQVARHFLEHTPVNLIVAVVNAAQLDRQLSLMLQLSDLDLPMLVVLNMSDESQRLGIQIDCNELQKALGCPILRVSAKYGHGIPRLLEVITQQIENSEKITVPASAFGEDDDLEVRLEKLVSDAVQMPLTVTDELTQHMDRVLLHPRLGLPLFFLTMYLMFEAVYTLGTPLQEGMAFLLDQAKVHWFEPSLVSTHNVLRSFLVEGIYAGVGTVLSFLPIILLFFLFMGIVENSGYLSRAAF